MTCPNCHPTHLENQRLRRLVDELWQNFRERHHQHHGYNSEPPEPALLRTLRMATGEVIEPSDQEAA